MGRMEGTDDGMGVGGKLGRLVGANDGVPVGVGVGSTLGSVETVGGSVNGVGLGSVGVRVG